MEQLHNRQDLCTGRLPKPIIDMCDKNAGLDWHDTEKKIKRIRLTCPICKRRLMSSIKIDDGDVIHQIPLHKPKKWWKKNGK